MIQELYCEENFEVKIPKEEFDDECGTYPEWVMSEGTVDLKAGVNWLLDEKMEVLRNSSISKRGSHFERTVFKAIPNIHVTSEFKEYMQVNRQHLWFERYLSKFLESYFEKKDYIPKEYHLTMFVFPEEDYREPMVKIIYRNDKKFDILKISDEIEESFKLYLVKVASNKEEFLDLWKIFNEFRFVIRRV